MTQPTTPTQRPLPPQRKPADDDGLLDSLGKAISAPLRDEAGEDPDLKHIEQKPAR